MKKKQKSLRTQWTVSILLLFAGMFCIMALYSMYMIGNGRREVRRVLQLNMEFQMSRLERNLEEVERFLVNQSLLKEEYAKIQNHGAELEYYLAQNEVLNTFHTALGSYDFMDGFCLYNPSDSLILLSRQSSYGTDIAEGLESGLPAVLGQYGEQYEKLTLKEKGEWRLEKIGTKWYLLKIIRNYGSYIASFVMTDRLAQEFQMNGDAVVCYTDGKPLQENGRSIYSGRILEVQGKCSKAPFCIKVRVPDGFAPGGREYLGYLLAGLMLFTVLWIFVSYQFRYQFSRPLTRLQRAIEEKIPAVSGSMKGYAECREFQQVYDTIEEMLERIGQMEKEVYQERLEKQQVSIQYLQLQINPHFLINCMNLVRNLIFLKKTREAQQVTVEVGNYMRYVMRPDYWVELEEELAHVRTYIRLQKFRYEECLEYKELIQFEAGEIHIPVMLIQTFVENAVKHQGGCDHLLEIRTEVVQTETGLWIDISDNGLGYDEEILKRLNAGEAIFNGQGEHVGIYNVRRRMELLYGKEASLSFANRAQGGAEVTILLPGNGGTG